MSSMPAALSALVEELVRLPGIGPKTAQRLAFHLLKVPREQAAALAEAIVGLKDRTRCCARCYNLAEEELCGVCQDPRRDSQLLCVVEEVNDLLAVERSREYRGLYHVLGGSPKAHERDVGEPVRLCSSDTLRRWGLRRQIGIEMKKNDHRDGYKAQAIHFRDETAGGGLTGKTS